MPAEPTQASEDTAQAKLDAAADPEIKPGVVHEPPDDGVPSRDADIPPTRPGPGISSRPLHLGQVVARESKPALEAPKRASATSIEVLAPPLTYPDDGPTSLWLRRIDNYLGTAEQAVLFAILVIVVLTASTHAILEKATHQGLWWSFDVIRGGTFSMAMIGAAYATQQQRHLAMDLISKKLLPRNRLVLASILEIFTIVVCVMLARSGLHQVDAYGTETGRHLIDAKNLVMFLPIGAALIAIHAAIHLLIHIDYLVRGKLPPERMRTGH